MRKEQHKEISLMMLFKYEKVHVFPLNLMVISFQFLGPL